MSKAEKKYYAQTMIKEWNTMTHQQEEVIAFKAQLVAITNKRIKNEHNSNEEYAQKKGTNKLHAKLLYVERTIAIYDLF
jgi:ABC-type Fe3+/spermidine/putrescine transport system ATPase subunit